MIRPSLYLIWPIHCDFPLFRLHLKKNHQLFDKIFIVFTNLNQKENYKVHVLNTLPFIIHSKPLDKKSDWRDDAVNTSLTLEPFSEYCLFMEQDFLINGDRFWSIVLDTTADFVYYEEGGRIHPAFALVRRTLVNKTTKDFAAHPPKYDHFGKFFEEITNLTPGINLKKLNLIDKIDYYHLGGLTQNYHCFYNNQPLYKPQDFLYYNYQSMLLPSQSMRFFRVQLEIYEKYEKVETHPFLEDFFPKDK